MRHNEMRPLDEASRIELGVPHDFLATEPIRELVYGGTCSRIDRPGSRG